jgi:hypothetical protein
MNDREQGEHHDTYVPPTPQNVKPKSSHDNAVEMAAGGKAEQQALAAREERLAAGNPQPPQPTPRDAATQTPAEQMTAPERVGRTDSTEGTGVGYAGEGAASYGTQGAIGNADTLADAPETTGRRQHMHTGDTARTTDTEQAQRHDQTQS